MSGNRKSSKGNDGDQERSVEGTTALSVIGLSRLLEHRLQKAGIKTVGALIDAVAGGEQSLLEIKGIGRKSAADILGHLESSGLYPVEDINASDPAEDEDPDPRIICVVNRKGGVGKTTTTFNLAGALAHSGYEVLVVDLDPMGSLCRSLRVYPGEVALSDLLIMPNGSLGDLIRSTEIQGLHVVPGDPNLRTFEMRHGTSPGYRVALRDNLSEVLSWKPYDFVLIDCPPSLGLISGNALMAAQEAIIPVDGSTYGMGALMDTVTVVRMVRDNVNRRLDIGGLLLNNVDLGTIYDRTVLDVLKQQFDGLVFESVVPSSPEADESSQLGEPVVFYAPNSWMAKAYKQLAGEIITRRPERAE